MTTERRVPGWLASAGFALLAWWTFLLALPFLRREPGAVTVIALSESRLLAAIAAADVALLEGSGRVMVLAGRSPGFVRQLYAAGGVLVLATDGRGCTGIRNPARDR